MSRARFARAEDATEALRLGVEKGAPTELSFGPGEPDLERPSWPKGSIPPAAEQEQESLFVGTNVRVTQLPGRAEAETAIAINPLNPQNLIVGAICPGGDCWYTSMDGGQTWSQGQFVPPMPSGGDPAVTFCGDGSAYYLELGFSSSGAAGWRTGLVVYKSNDGGLNWSAPITLLDHTTSFNFVTDKPWITCDATPGSPFANRVYVEHRDGTGADSVSVIRLRRSADGGATWQGPVQVSSGTAAPQNQGYLAVGNSGELYVSWYRAVAPGDPNLIRFDKSTNGGVSFGTTDVDVTTAVPIQTDPNFRRGGGSPPMGVDHSNGAYRGNIYIAWPDGRNGDADILLTRSTDGGNTWSTPLRVNDDAIGNGADQWSPGLAVDSKGRVIVTYYDDRRFIGGTRYEIWGQISRDGGQTFDTAFLISDTPSVVPSTTFIGDYDGVVATPDRLYTVWADQRPGTVDPPDIYTDLYLNNFDYDEVESVRFTDHDTLAFDLQDARFGQDLAYDVVSGLVTEMRADQGFARASCLAAAWPESPFVDTRVPPAPDAYYYLIRAHGPSGIGTYGDGSPARPNVRDPLDETLALCP